MKEVKPRFKPSQKMKKRYVLFNYKMVSFEEAKAKLFSLGLKPLSLIEFDSKAGKGIVRCERSKLSKLKALMKHAGFETLKASGSVKKLREIA